MHEKGKSVRARAWGGVYILDRVARLHSPSGEAMLDVVRYVRGLFQAPDTVTHSDRILLERFAQRRDESAFAALVERHGPFVWGVCRRGLGHTQDAEDAFQATFLVLARKASAVGWRDDIAGWLHAVAVRIVHKVRAQTQRRLAVHRSAPVTPTSPAAELPDDLSAVLDEEIERLPEKYRQPIVLCYLQGKTYAEAAALLGWKAGTVSGRLARARDLLRGRLERRGLAPAVLPVLAGEVLPAGLAGDTIRASLMFAASQGTLSGPAAVLAEGVLRRMVISRICVVVLAFVAVTAAGFGLVRAAFRPAPPPPVVPPAPAADAGPALPAAWAGRWITDPFAGTVAFEVQHLRRGNQGDRYLIQDPAVVADLVRQAKLVGVQNGMAVGLVPPARLIVVRKGGERDDFSVLSDSQLQCWDGILHVDAGFLAAVNRQVSRQAKRQVDITQSLPFEEPAVERIKPSLRSLTAGFKELEVAYLVGKRPHRTRLTDATVLEALHKQVKVLGQRAATAGPASSRGLRIVSKDGSTFQGQIISATEIADHEAGRFTLDPGFLKALAREVSQREGREIDLTGENRPTEKQMREVDEVRKRLNGVRSVRFTTTWRGREQKMTVDDATEVRQLLARLEVIEVTPVRGKIERRTPLAECTLADGKKVVLQRVEAGAALEAGPLMADLIEAEGLGRVWIGDQWKYGLHTLAHRKAQEEKWKRDLETSRRVCADLPAFLKLVKSVGVSYREGENRIRHSLNGAASVPFVRILATAKLEKLDWNAERWGKEMDRLHEADAGILELTPGLGFALTVVVLSERELLIPEYGRLLFHASPLPELQKAIDARNATKVELLPVRK